MAKSQTFLGVTVAMLYRMRAAHGDNYALELEPDGVSGTVTAASTWGQVIVHFNYTAEREEVRVTILKKPMLLPAPLLWAGLTRVARETQQQIEAESLGGPQAA